MASKKKNSLKKHLNSFAKKRGVRQVIHVTSYPFRRFFTWQAGMRPQNPHRSFRRTYRRDYARPLAMPGYIPFTLSVYSTLSRHKRTFGGLILVYALLSGLLVGIASQSTYTQLSELLRSTGGEIFQGSMGKVGEAGVLLLTGLAGGINPGMTEMQQLIGGLLVLSVWLTTVWLLRAFLAGQTPKLKDGLYNSGAPFIPTFLLGLMLLVQLLPAAIAAIGIAAAMPTGLVSAGAEAMLFWFVVFLLVMLSMYWVTSTLIALVVITLPGMHPLRALKLAHELVVGRRLPIILRMVWLFAVTVVLWAVTLIPIILLDAWIKGMWEAVEQVPVVPIALLLASSASVVWVASYIYLLYRKVVDDDSAPA